MRARPGRVGSLVLALGLLSLAPPAFAIITRLIPLREVLAAEQFIFTVKVATLDPDGSFFLKDGTQVLVDAHTELDGESEHGDDGHLTLAQVQAACAATP